MSLRGGSLWDRLLDQFPLSDLDLLLGYPWVAAHSSEEEDGPRAENIFHGTMYDSDEGASPLQ